MPTTRRNCDEGRTCDENLRRNVEGELQVDGRTKKEARWLARSMVSIFSSFFLRLFVARDGREILTGCLQRPSSQIPPRGFESAGITPVYYRTVSRCMRFARTVTYDDSFSSGTLYVREIRFIPERKAFFLSCENSAPRFRDEVKHAVFDYEKLESTDNEISTILIDFCTCLWEIWGCTECIQYVMQGRRCRR